MWRSHRPVAAILAGRSRSGTCSIHRSRPRTGSITDCNADRSGFGTNRSVPLPGDRKDISPLSDYVVRAVHQEALPIGARTVQKPLLRVDAGDGSVRILAMTKLRTVLIVQFVIATI